MTSERQQVVRQQGACAAHPRWLRLLWWLPPVRRLFGPLPSPSSLPSPSEDIRHPGERLAVMFGRIGLKSIAGMARAQGSPELASRLSAMDGGELIANAIRRERAAAVDETAERR